MVIRELINLIGFKVNDNQIKDANKKFDKLKGTIKAIGIAAAIAIIGVGTAAIKAASDAEETLNKFNVVFGNIQDEANKTAKTIANGFGLSQTKSKEFLSGIGDLLTGLGMTQEESLKLARQATELGVDIASFANLSGGAEQAVQALTKGMLGEREMLKALGVSITETDLKDFAASQNLVWKEMNKASRAALTLNLVMKQSPNAIGDFARSSGSLANQLRILKAAFEDILVGEGTKILPAARKVVGEIITLVKTDLMPIISNLTTSLMPIIETVLKLLRPVFNLLVPLLKILSDWAVTLGRILATTVIPFIETLVEKFTPILNDLSEVLNELFTTLEPVLTVILNLFFILLKNALYPIILQLKVFLAFLKPLFNILNIILMPFLNALNKILTVVDNLIEQLYDLFYNVLDRAIGWISEKLSGIREGFINIFSGIGDFFTKIINSVIDGLNWLIEKTNKIAKTKIELIERIAGIDKTINEINNNQKTQNFNMDTQINLQGGTPGSQNSNRQIAQAAGSIFNLQLKKVLIENGGL